VSYTVDTLEQLHAEDPARELFLILGADALAELPTWKQPARVCELALPMVVCRAYAPEPDFSVLADLVPRERIAEAQAVEVKMAPIGIASSDIRRRIESGKSIRFRTPRAVEKYIETHCLYQSTLDRAHVPNGTH
jgi:nicotinate-nucleotide adenylyltransferase